MYSEILTSLLILNLRGISYSRQHEVHDKGTLELADVVAVSVVFLISHILKEQRYLCYLFNESISPLAYYY